MDNKRPLTAYILYCKHNLERIKNEKPYFSRKELIQLLVIEWICLTEDGKNKYKQLEIELKQENDLICKKKD